MNDKGTMILTSSDDVEALKTIVTDTLKMAQQKGATQAEVGLSVSQGLSVATRLRDVETIEHQQDNGLGISVYFEQHKGSANTSNLDPEAIRKTVEAACNIAKYTSADPCAGLADAGLMATQIRPLDLYHPWDLSPDAVIDLALECETAALDYDARIVNSEGALVDLSTDVSVYGNTHGFLQAEQKSRHSISCAVVGEVSGNMQRDYYYDVNRNPAHLAAAQSIGEQAAARTVKRLDARKLKTRRAPVILVAELARGLIGHFLSAISGSAQYRKASFLLDAIDTQIFPDYFQLVEQPFKPQALGSANYDAEGVSVAKTPLVSNGVIQNYLLDSYAARKLGLQSTGHAGGVHNLFVSNTGKTLPDLLQTLHQGLLVTELMGQGVNSVTGDYSRGAAGFWVENGEIQFPVEEVTIAANLRDMFKDIIEVGTDIDQRGNVLTGSILIDNMMIAGTD